MYRTRDHTGREAGTHSGTRVSYWYRNTDHWGTGIQEHMLLKIALMQESFIPVQELL